MLFVGSLIITICTYECFLNVLSYYSRTCVILQIGIYCLTYIQSCINPFVYGIMCKNFRMSLQHACKRVKGPCMASFPESATNVSLDLADSRNSSGSFKINNTVNTNSNWQTSYTTGCDKQYVVMGNFKPNGVQL